MKLYKLKEEALDKLSEVLTEDFYEKYNVTESESYFKALGVATLELQEVEQRVELEICSYNGVEMGLFKVSEIDWTPKEKDLCEAILNADETTQKAILVGGQLNPNTNWLDIDSLDDKHFYGWYNTQYVHISPKSDSSFNARGIKAVLKQYLKEL